MAEVFSALQVEMHISEKRSHGFLHHQLTEPEINIADCKLYLQLEKGR